MATGTCEVLERDLECPEAIEELPVLAERIPRLSREDVRKDAEVLQSEEEVNSSSLGIEKEERNTLHVIEKDLDEFVESITDTPVVTEKTVTRVERVEETASSASPQVPKTLPLKRKAEPCTIGPMKEEIPWEGLTLNKCILIASFVALLSMGFQVFQDVIDVDGVPEAEPRLWAQPACSLPEDGAGERGELWFFKSWLSWLEPEEAEDPEAKVEGMQQDSPGRAEPRRGQKPSALEKEVEKPRESVVAQPERGVKKEMKPKDRPPEGQASKMHRAPPAGEEEEEGQQRSSKRARGEGKEGKRREGKERGERPRRDEGKGRHPKPDSPPQGPGRKEHRHDESGKRDSKQHKGRKPWEQHKFKESKRHD